MNIRVRYFARLREKLATEQEQLALPAGVSDIAALCRHLATRGGVWAEELAGQRPLMAAINEELKPLSASFAEGDEVALFPPVTGG